MARWWITRNCCIDLSFSCRCQVVNKKAAVKLIESLLPTLPNGRVMQVVIGLHWTAVAIEIDGRVSCGLASTVVNSGEENARRPDIDRPGQLEQFRARELAQLVKSSSLPEVSVGLAALNALLPVPVETEDLNADAYIARHGSQSKVAVIGHFPFVERLRPRVSQLWVLELNPKDGDFPASHAPQIIPQADIIAITSTTLINGTFDALFELRKPGANVMLLGPSTPLTPRLFEFGIDVLSGSIVTQTDQILPLVRQGANFRQLKQQGVRLVTFEKPAAAQA